MATALLAGSLLNGCGLMPYSEFVQPRVTIPQQWQHQPTTGTNITNREQWWKNFQDPVLDGLIEMALRTNNDLAVAAIKVRRAQLVSGLTCSTSLTNLLQNPVATLGTGLVLPFVQWNTMKLNIKVSETKYEEAVVNFRQTLYKALSDDEDNLSANTQYREERIRLEQALASARQAEQLVEARYRAGATGMQSWPDAQESRRAAEIRLATNHLNRLNTLMKLYQALGGDMQV